MGKAERSDIRVSYFVYATKTPTHKLKTVGIANDKKIIYELEGANYRQVIDIILRQFDRILTEEEIQDIGSKKLTVFGQIARVKPFNGIRELLKTLKAKYKLAVVSGSNRSTVHETLNTFFPDTFHVIVNGKERQIIPYS